jgi:hypothetical protein
MSAKVTRRNLLEMAATGGAALSVAATAAKPALAQDTAPRGQNDYDVFDLGDVALQSGITLPRAKLAYKTYGKLTATRDNAVLMPTYYGGRHIDNEGCPWRVCQTPDSGRREMLPEEETLRLFRKRPHAGSII